MAIHLTLDSDLEAMVRERVASGRYESESDVLREALRLLDRREAEERLKRYLLDGVESGPARPADWDALEREVLQERSKRGL